MRGSAKYLLFTAILLILAGSTALADIRDIDYPHNADGGYTCWNCHFYTANPAPWAQHEPTDIDDTPYNNLCLSCHNDIDALAVTTHSSLETSTKYGSWTVECRQCHWTHHQQQTRSHGALSYVFSGTTSQAVGNTLTSTGAAWTADQYVGYLVIPNVNQKSYGYNILSNTADTLIIDGTVDLTKLTPGSDTLAIIYGNMIKNPLVTPNSGSKTIKFFDKTGTDSFAYDESTTGTDPTPTGVCQVCHTQTTHWRNDGTLSAWGIHATKNGENCIPCHEHGNGFRGSGHDATHFGFDSVGGVNCQDCHTGPTVEGDVHSGLCAACHDTATGTNRNTEKLGDATFGIDGDARPADGVAAAAEADPANYTVIWGAKTCSTCHPVATYDISTTHHESRNNYADDGNCTQCHADSSSYAGNHTAGNGAEVVLDSQCDDCHSGTEGAAAPTLNMTVSDSDNTKHDSCLDCHNTDDNATLKGVYGVAQQIVAGGGNCTDCHTTIAGDFTAHLLADGHSELTATGTTCGGCHSGDLLTSNKIHALNLANDDTPGNNTANACLDCHLTVTTDGSFVTGTGAASPYSTTSVGVSNVGAVDSTRTCATCHSSYASTFGDTHREKDHSGITTNACTSCHTGDKITSVHDLAGGGGTTACLKCHTNVTDNGALKAGTAGDATGHVAGTDSSCNDCHGTAEGGPADDFDGGSHASPTHTNVAGAATHCTGCHTGDVVSVIHSSTTTGNNTAATCTDCHNDPLNADGTLLDGTTAGTPYGTTSVGDATLHTPFSQSSCTTCHAPVGAGECYFNDNRHQNRHSRITFNFNNNCTNCHDQGSTNTESYLVTTIHKGTCNNCHNATTHGPEAKTNADASVGIGGATLECLGCHGGQGGTDNYTSRFKDAHDTKDHSGITSTDGCTVNCHTGDKITAVHDVASAGGDAPCLNCHTNITDNGSLVAGTDGDASGHTFGVNSTCYDCHTGVKGGPGDNFETGHNNPDHTGMSGNAECTGCHSTSITAAGGVHAILANDAETTNNTASTCLDCHENMTTDGRRLDGTKAGTPWDITAIGDATVGALGTARTCTTCHAAFSGTFTQHMEVDHSGLTGNAACTGCHAGYMILGANIHKGHCTDCHTNTTTDGTLIDGANGDGDATGHVLGVTSDCLDCHDITQGGPGNDFDGGHNNPDHSGISGTDACISCHTGDIVTGTHTHAGSCTDCHANIAANGTLVDGTAAGSPQGLTKIGDATVHVLGVTSYCKDCHDVSLGGPGGDFDGGSHADYDHSGISGNAACSGCHTGDIITSANTHNNTCTSCHTNTTTNGAPRAGANGYGDSSVHVLGVTSDCLDCHDVSQGGPGSDFDGGSHADYDHSGVGGDAACTGCHTGDIISSPLIHNNTCISCHTNIGANGTLRAGSVGTALNHVLGTTSTCIDCHSLETPSQIHHETEAAKGNNCTSNCHGNGSYGDQRVAHTSMIANEAAGANTLFGCATCHTGTPGAATGASVSPTDAKIHDACRTCHTFDANLEGILVSATNNKGVNTNPLPDGGDIGGTNGGGTCIVCHTQAIDIYHHAMDYAAVGECEKCHVDPRVTYTPGDNGGSSNVPTQLGCRHCHVSNSGGNMTITAFANRTDYNVYTTDWTKSTANSGGHVIANSAAKINNYGICFFCHDGTTAQAVRVWHARPDQHDTGGTWDLGTEDNARARDQGNEAHYVAGRRSDDSGGQGGTISGFNLFYTDYRESNPGSWQAGGNRNADSDNEDYVWYDTPQASMDAFVTNITIPAAVFNANTTGNAPIFAAIAASSGTAPAAADDIRVMSAEYNGTNLVVTVENNNGCGSMTMTYDGANFTNWSGSGTAGDPCVVSNPDTYSAAADVDVTTSNAEGIDVTGFPVAYGLGATAVDDPGLTSPDTGGPYAMYVLDNDTGSHLSIVAIGAVNKTGGAGTCGTITNDIIRIGYTPGSGDATCTFTYDAESGDISGASQALATLTQAPNTPPTLTVNQPAGGDDSVFIGSSWNINYDLADSEDTVTADFYYDTDNTGLDGVPIPGACHNAPAGTGATCSWDTTGMAPGDYYIYGKTYDGVNTEVTDYSSGVITLNEPVVQLDSLSGTETYDGTLDSGSFTYEIGTGSNRLLIVAISTVETSTFSSRSGTPSASYGGTALTQIVDGNVTGLTDLWMGYLNESDIAGRGSNTLSWNNGNTGWDRTKVHVFAFKNVKQSGTGPIADSDITITNANVTTRTTKSFTWSTGDMPIYVAESREDSATHTIAPAEYTEKYFTATSGTDIGSMSSGYKTDVITAGGTSTIGVTFNASDRAGLAAAILRAAANP